MHCSSHFLLVWVLCLVLLETGCESKSPSLCLDSHVPLVEISEVANPLGLHDSPRFRLLYDGDTAWAQHIAELLESSATNFYRSFSHMNVELDPVPAPLTWICFNDADAFRSYASSADRMKGTGLDAYYSARTNRVAMLRKSDDQARTGTGYGWNSSTGLHAVDEAYSLRHADAVRVMHEVAHQLAFNTGLQKRGVTYPMWATEGLATNFETGRLPIVATEPGNPRSKRLMEIRQSGRLIPLHDLVAMTRVESPHNSHDVYAQAWGLFRMLHLRHGESLMAYFEDMRRYPTGRGDTRKLRDQFVKSFGPMEDMQRQWDDFLAELAGFGRPS